MLRPGSTYPFKGHQYLSLEYYNYEMDVVFIRRISVNFIEKDDDVQLPMGIDPLSENPRVLCFLPHRSEIGDRVFSS